METRDRLTEDDMTSPLVRVQAAWATGDPLALHREVERLAAEGQPRQALEDALETPLLPSIRPWLGKRLHAIVRERESAAAVYQRRHVADAAGEVIGQLAGVEAEHVPAAAFQEVVAGVVVHGGFGVGMPGVAVAFD